MVLCSMRFLVILAAFSSWGCSSTLAYGAVGLFDSTVLTCEGAEVDHPARVRQLRDVCDDLYQDLGNYTHNLGRLENLTGAQ